MVLSVFTQVADYILCVENCSLLIFSGKFVNKWYINDILKTNRHCSIYFNRNIEIFSLTQTQTEMIYTLVLLSRKRNYSPQRSLLYFAQKVCKLNIKYKQEPWTKQHMTLVHFKLAPGLVDPSADGLFSKWKYWWIAPSWISTHKMPKNVQNCLWCQKITGILDLQFARLNLTSWYV